MSAPTRVARMTCSMVVAACFLAGCGSDRATSTVARPAGNGATSNSKAANPADGVARGKSSDLSSAVGDDYCSSALALTDFSTLGSDPVTLVAGTSGAFAGFFGCKWYAGPTNSRYPPFEANLDKFTPEQAQLRGLKTTGDGWIGGLFSQSYTAAPIDGLGNEAVYLLSKRAERGQISGMAAFPVSDTIVTVKLELNGPVDSKNGSPTTPATTADQVKAEVLALATKVQHNLADFKHG